MAESRKIAVIGAGAAGCFCAIELKRLRPELEVTVYEAGNTPLAKVSVTGGGRCNLTNSFEGVSRLEEVYPRGAHLMKRALRQLSHEDTMRWFSREGVRLTVQNDGCVFPVSQDAMQIVRTLENLMRRLGVALECGRRVESIRPGTIGRWDICLDGGALVEADAVIATLGGSSKMVLERMFAGLGLEIADPVPSLFTFKIADEGLRSLMGTVVDDVRMSICGTSFRSGGTLLVTDWGLSGPATLRLSSYAARHLAENKYLAPLCVNWMSSSEAEVCESLSSVAAASPKKMVCNGAALTGGVLSDRLWKYLVARAGVRGDCRWAELGSKGLYRLVSVLTSDRYDIEGRARFKEEFVTCGGIALSNIDIGTMASRRHQGLFFAGEVLDVDALTGGFNLQAAWSTGFVAARSAANLFQPQSVQPELEL